MNNVTTKMLTVFAIAVSAVVLAGFTTSQSQAPEITAEPQDQMVQAGSDATLSAEAVNGRHYQWLRNGVAIRGATKSALSFAKIDIKDAGNYSCDISSGANIIATRVASLLVIVRQHAGTAATTLDGVTATPMQDEDQMLIYGTPVVSSGSSGGGCPGNYAGYVLYAPTSGWGFPPTANDAPYTASDGSGRTDTSVQFSGRRGDIGCNLTSVTIPNPPWSTEYRFAIYFPSNVPTTNYPIALTGF